jgi:hypothetical protein
MRVAGARRVAFERALGRPTVVLPNGMAGVRTLGARQEPTSFSRRMAAIDAIDCATMRDQIFADNAEGRQQWFTVDVLPDVCPTCHHNVQPKQLLGVLEGTEYEGAIEAVYKCPNKKCQSLFFGRFTKSRAPNHYADCHMFQGVGPWTPRKEQWPKEVEKVSPRFVETYDSANAASAHDLHDLVGMGMRKALEFLVKDYEITRHPTEEAQIRRMPLAQVIATYCDSGKVKATAKRATWLGNDETHYERVWVQKDVNDLRTLIKLTVNWIESEILTSQYTEDMPDKKPPAST